MFSTVKEFTKSAKALIGGAEIVKKAVYTFPQFGTEPEKAVDSAYSQEEALTVIQEALNYFGADALVRHLNWSIGVAVQRRSNNDLRADGVGLSAIDQALVDTLMAVGRRNAEADCSVPDDKGNMVCDRKSEEYLESMRATIEARLKTPKFAHLVPVFTGATANTTPLEISLMAPGSLNPGKDSAAIAAPIPDSE